jgi:hypothetical protein
METYNVPKQTLQGIIDYLVTRPYKEVAVGLEELAKIIKGQETPAPVEVPTDLKSKK